MNPDECPVCGGVKEVEDSICDSCYKERQETRWNGFKEVVQRHPSPVEEPISLEKYQELRKVLLDTLNDLRSMDMLAFQLWYEHKISRQEYENIHDYTAKALWRFAEIS